MDELRGACRLVFKSQGPQKKLFSLSVEFHGLSPSSPTSSFGFKTLRINVCYWREKVPGSYGVSRAFPCFLGLGLSAAPHHIYGLPSGEYPGLMKVSGKAQREPVGPPLRSLQIWGSCSNFLFHRFLGSPSSRSRRMRPYSLFAMQEPHPIQGPAKEAFPLQTWGSGGGGRRNS